MEKNNDIQYHITERQFIFVLIGAATGVGILSLPRIVTRDLLQDEWLSVLVGALLPLLSLFLTDQVCKKYPGYSLFDIANELFGKIVGKTFAIVYMVYAISVSATSIRIYSEITSSYILPKTPLPIILLVYLAFVVYTIKNGSETVGRFSEITFYVLPLSILLMIPSWSVSSYTNLLPINESGISGVYGILKNSLKVSYSYSCTELILIYYPMVKGKGKLVRDGAIVLSIIALMYTFMTISCIIVIGAEAMGKVTWPSILLYKMVNIPVIERAGILFVIIWTVIAVRPSVVYSFAASYSISHIINTKLKKHITIVSIITGVIIFIVASTFKSLQQTFDISKYVGYSYFIVAIGYPIIFLLASYFSKWREPKDA